jgi:branched-chain amino acid transport system permease protein
MSIFPQLLANAIIAGSIYALVALSFSLIYNATKFFNLSHGAMITVGGYATFYLAKTLGWNMYLSVIVAMIFSGLVGVCLDRFIFRPLRRKKASNMIMLVASLGAFTVIQAIIAILFTSQFQTLSNLITHLRIYQIFGASITQVQTIILILAVVIMATLVVMLKKTLFGKAITAISDDEEVAKIVGIDTDKIISWVFFIGSAIAGLAGAMVGFDTGIEPTMGLLLLLGGIIAVIVGGITNIYGALLGAFVVASAENFGIWKLAGEWRPAIAYSLLILFLLFRPQGIIKK